jgi:hypothetical protein
MQGEVEPGFGRDFHLLALGHGLHGGSTSGADARPDRSAFSAAGKAAN